MAAERADVDARTARGHAIAADEVRDVLGGGAAALGEAQVVVGGEVEEAARAARAPERPVEVVARALQELDLGARHAAHRPVEAVAAAHVEVLHEEVLEAAEQGREVLDTRRALTLKETLRMNKNLLEKKFSKIFFQKYSFSRSIYLI